MTDFGEKYGLQFSFSRLVASTILTALFILAYVVTTNAHTPSLSESLVHMFGG